MFGRHLFAKTQSQSGFDVQKEVKSLEVRATLIRKGSLIDARIAWVRHVNR